MDGFRLGDGTTFELHRSLNRLSKQAAASVGNLANIDTPGYRAVEVRFDDVLGGKLQLSRTREGHFGGGGRSSDPTRVSGQVADAPVTRVRTDGNTVDIDVEMARLAAFRDHFSAVTRLVGKRFALLRYVASDGRS